MVTSSWSTPTGVYSPLRVTRSQPRSTWSFSPCPTPGDLAIALPAYRIGPILGRGTFGLVYAARHIALGRAVAIKQLWPDLVGDCDARSRFRREARLLAALDHPNIVRVYDYVQGDVQAIVLERMHGGTLHERLRRSPLAVDEARALMLPVLDGLEHAHRRGVLHRDIKPSNLLFADDGVMKLADFGLAKAADCDWAALTNTSPQPGTPTYMAPEQISPSLGGISPSTDVWAAGAVLYEMVTGRRPFDAVRGISEMLRARLDAAPRPLAEVAPGISPALSRVVARALARLSADRFSTAAEFADGLRDAF
jgi:serine/threonine-protein kinase